MKKVPGGRLSPPVEITHLDHGVQETWWERIRCWGPLIRKAAGMCGCTGPDVGCDVLRCQGDSEVVLTCLDA